MGRDSVMNRQVKKVAPPNMIHVTLAVSVTGTREGAKYQGCPGRGYTRFFIINTIYRRDW